MNRYQKIINYLELCVQKDMLSHAYIFYGPDESAKKAVALKFADKIFNRSINDNFSFNPDLILTSADADEERSINLIRQLKKFLNLSPCCGRYKIAIIDAAHKLNIYAQSALLKIFEEAPIHAIIILCAKTIDGIPETIASRGVKLPFWGQNNNLPPADFVTPKADFVQPTADEKIIETFNEIIVGDPKDPHRIFEKFNDYAAIEIFKSWLWYLRTKFLLNPNQKLYNLLKISQNIFFKLNETNINPKFAYDELLLGLAITN